MEEEGFEDFNYDPFDWPDFEEDSTIDEEGGEGGFDSEGGMEPDAVETETIESANSASEDTQEQSSTVEEQEANTNTINETEAEQEEYGTPVDLSWISTSDLSEEEKNDSQIGSNASELADTKADTKTETSKTEVENKTEYPNGMSKEEFNAMYEFALANVEEGSFAGYDTTASSIAELDNSIDKIEANIGWAETANRPDLVERYESEKSQLEAQRESAQEQLTAMQDFIANYSNLYQPDEKSEDKLQIDMGRLEAVRQAFASSIEKTRAAEREFYKLTGKEASRGNIGNVLSNSGFEISDYTFQNNTVHIDMPNGDVVFGQVTKDEKGWIAESNKGTIGEFSTRAEAMSARNEMVLGEIQNVVGSMNNPELSAAFGVVAAGVEQYDARNNAWQVEREISDIKSNSVENAQKEIMDKYAKGEINAVQAAVALNKAGVSNNFSFNPIMAETSSAFSGLAGTSTGKPGTVGIDTLLKDVLPEVTSKTSATNISKDITMEFKNLNDLKDTLSKVDTSTAKDLQSFNELKTQVESINTRLDQLASSAYLDLAKDLLGKGIELAELDKQPEMQQLNNEIYALAQMILDKASELKEISGQYGLNNLSMKELKENRGAYSSQVALITGKNGVTLLDKSDMKALVEYSKSLDATIASAQALMLAAASLHGAQDVQGGKYAQAWKAEAAEQKLTAKEWFATAATSTLALLATMVGFSIMPANPLVGGALAYAGTKSLVEKTGRTVGKETTAHLTNYERMFGSKDKTGAYVISNVYDRGFNKANYGDVKSVGTYTTFAGATIDALNAMAMLTNPVTAIAGLGYLYNAGKSMTVDLAKGSYEGKKNNLMTNVWQIVENIEEWADTYLGSQELAELMAAGDTTDIVETEERNERKEGRSVSSDYGTTDGEVADNADKYYSGASEQTKNANLAKDYNAGMEENVNEAVSDKYVKVFKVMLDKEPDYIRKVLIAIPKNHSEREW